MKDEEVFVEGLNDEGQEWEEATEAEELEDYTLEDSLLDGIDELNASADAIEMIFQLIFSKYEVEEKTKQLATDALQALQETIDAFQEDIDDLLEE